MTSKICYSCGEAFPPASTVYTVLGKQYHNKCFNCSQCRFNLASNGQFVQKGDTFICVPCAERDQEMELRGGVEECASGCGRQVHPADAAMKAVGGTFHEECFRCHDCKSPLGSAPFVHEKGTTPPKLTCVACNDKKERKEANPCGVCGQPILGDSLVALGMQLHQNCFKCTKCRAVITTREYSVVSENAYCIPCGAQFKQDQSKEVKMANDETKRPKCEVCKKHVPEVCVETNGASFCPGCFRCCNCQAAIQPGNYITRYPDHSKPWCIKCGKESKSSAALSK